ncbi:cardiolipin synthase (CMP-forming) [Syngnathoides biaculeatus]|uniref:cardiolipin synthase (CMP-forming) n=1 Tax=Syngnathoides biaculeatus TaxID=300417 RepID=UPI002ADE1F44|nr:cardiolipin synthase (CMP-forming) [Syngnathoides biaculeatus]
MMVLCFRSTPAPLCRKAAECLLSARRGAASRLEASSWRLGRAPVSGVGGSSRTLGLGGLDGRAPFSLGSLPSKWWRPCGTLLVLRGGRDSQALLSTGGRGLSGKINQETSNRVREAAPVPVPGQGLFNFKELYENPWTVPNLLCVCRIVLAPFLGHLIVQQHFHLSLALFTLAGATDLLDGYIARTWPTQKSALGSALDPLADKILISILYVSLTYADIIPAPLTALVVFRDVGLIAAVFWVRYKTVPPPVTLSKFFNPCYTTAQLKPTLFSKVNTAIQLVLVAASLAAPVFQYTDSILLQGLWFITAVTTTASGYSYWHYGRKTVRVLNTRSP